jgi:hypothetical protein
VLVHKVKLNETGYMLTLIGAVHNTGGPVFSDSQIASLTVPKQEHQIIWFANLAS